MLFTPRFLIPCQPKTRSTLRRNVVAPIIGAETFKKTRDDHYSGHRPAWQVPHEVREARDVVAVVRDPVEWYSSVYRHLMGSRPQGKPLAGLRAWGNGSEDWRAVVYGWTHPLEVRSPPNWEDALYNPGALSPAAWRMLGGAGMWTWSTRYHYGDGSRGFDMPERIVQCERMGEGFERLGLCKAEQIDELAPVNVSRATRSEMTPIDDEIRAWVRDADADLAGLCGYPLD